MLATTSTLAVETFDVDGSTAVIHPAAAPAKDKPWLWYAPALKGGEREMKLPVPGRPHASISEFGFKSCSL